MSHELLQGPALLFGGFEGCVRRCLDLCFGTPRKRFEIRHTSAAEPLSRQLHHNIAHLSGVASHQTGASVGYLNLSLELSDRLSSVTAHSMTLLQTYIAATDPITRRQFLGLFLASPRMPSSLPNVTLASSLLMDLWQWASSEQPSPPR